MNNWRIFLKGLFKDKKNSVLSLVLIILLAQLAWGLFRWLILDAVWSGDAATCRQAEGACLIYLYEKARFILFGFYPIAEIWRAILGVMLLMANLKFLAKPIRWTKKNFLFFICHIIVILLLWRGGGGILPYVPMDKWGGILLTLLLAITGVIVSYPAGILLALGRRSELPLIRTLCTIFIELIRGVPMISLLFMSSVMMPLFLPKSFQLGQISRAILAIILFSSAYMAEVIRGGLQGVPVGQYEAAKALGLTYWQSMRKIILPQALRSVVPPTVNTVIGLFKDTSLVVIISLFDLMMTTKMSLKDPDWMGFTLETYFFAAVIYYFCCSKMANYAHKLETRWSLNE